MFFSKGLGIVKESFMEEFQIIRHIMRHFQKDRLLPILRGYKDSKIIIIIQIRNIVLTTKQALL